MEVPRLGVKLELKLPATYTIAHSNARSLNHLVRPGIKHTTSWLLVGFISTVPLTGTLSYGFSNAQRVGRPNPHIVQWLTVHVSVHPKIKIRSEDK